MAVPRQADVRAAVDVGGEAAAGAAKFLLLLGFGELPLQFCDVRIVGLHRMIVSSPVRSAAPIDAVNHLGSNQRCGAGQPGLTVLNSVSTHQP